MQTAQIKSSTSQQAGNIHPSAVIDASAKVHPSAKIGPFCIVGGDAVIEESAELVSHVVIAGKTTIGAGTKIFPFASLGHAPQDLKYKGEASTLIIGKNCIIREHVTMNPGTQGGGMETRVGDNCLFMVGAHVAHDCVVGDHVIMANNATLAGHVHVGDYAILGGLCAVHQHVRIGKHAMIGGLSGVENDVIPYGSVMGDRARLSGLNIVGLKRRGFGREEIHLLRNAYRLLFAEEGTLSERVEDVAELFKDNSAVTDIVRFINAESDRAICQPKNPALE